MEIKNRSAFYEYYIDDKYVAGIILTGTEVKSLREGKANFNDSYCIFQKGELWIKSFHISEYSHGTVNNHDPIRERKLLLNRRELKKIDKHWSPQSAAAKGDTQPGTILAKWFNERNLPSMLLQDIETRQLPGLHQWFSVHPRMIDTSHSAKRDRRDGIF